MIISHAGSHDGSETRSYTSQLQPSSTASVFSLVCSIPITTRSLRLRFNQFMLIHSFIDSRGSHVCCWTPEMQFMHSRIHCQTGASCWVMLPSFFPFSPARNHQVSTFNEPLTSPSALKTGPVSLSPASYI